MLRVVASCISSQTSPPNDAASRAREQVLAL